MLVNRSFEALFGIDRERADRPQRRGAVPGRAGAGDAGQRPAGDARAGAAPGRGGDRAAGRPAHLPVRQVPAACDSARSRTPCARSRRTSPSASAPRRRCASPSSTSARSSTPRTTPSCRSTSLGASRPGTRRRRRPSAGPRRRRSGAASPRPIIPARHRGSHNRRASSGSWRPGKASLLDRRVELEALHRDGHEFPVEMTITAVRAGGRYAFNAFLHDITRAQAGRGDAAPAGRHRAVLPRRDRRDHRRRARSRAGTRARASCTATGPRR